jgi:hypothetical protein
MLAILLDNGADPNVHQKASPAELELFSEGGTALDMFAHCFIHHDMAEVYSYLIDRGAHFSKPIRQDWRNPRGRVENFEVEVQDLMLFEEQIEGIGISSLFSVLKLIRISV